MYIALSKNGERVFSDEAIKGEEYFCPICNSEVIVREGNIREKHFSHKANQCTDNWNYDMSEWHREKQAYFPKEMQEVIVTHKGRKHRADILDGNIVIEFQNSPISVDEFCERNEFYTDCGYKVAWVFNLTEHYEEGRVFYPSDNDDWLRGWRYPLKVLEYGPIPQKKNSNVSIWISIDTDDEKGYISKVVWSATEYDRPTYKRFKLSPNEIDLSSDINLKKLFYERIDWINDDIKSLPAYNKKVTGIKGRSKNQYICPKTSDFGLSIGGDKGCSYCHHCGMIVEKFYQKKYWEIYCCFPEILKFEYGTIRHNL